MSPATPASSPSERLYRQIIDGLKEAVFQTDPQGRWAFLSQAWTELMGIPVQESLGHDALQSVHPEDRPRLQESLQSLLERKQDHSRHDVRYLRRDGSVLWVEVLARPLVGEDGSLQGLCGTLSDVSERRRTGD